MATGDLKNNLRRLQSKLKLISYPKDIDIKAISKGLAQEYLPLLHYILLDFSRPMAQHIINNDMELYGKSDDKFMAAVYKVFRDIFHYKPSITRQQFFSRGYTERKIMMVVDLIRMVKDKHKELCKAMPAASQKNISGSLSRLRCTPGKEQGASARRASESDKPTTPDLLTASSSETPVFLPDSDDGAKATEGDIGYHTAETSPTFRTQSEQDDIKQTSVSVHELRAKFESSALRKQESQESKMSDMELEENPVIQALVKQIVHLEDQLTEQLAEMAEETKTWADWKKKVEKEQSDMHAHMVLMQNAITLLESKLSVTPAEAKTLRPALAQGIAQDAAVAFLRPNQRRPENVPLPESPAIPCTPNHTPSSAQTPPPPLSISAMDLEQDDSTTAKEKVSPDDSHPIPNENEEPVQDTSLRYQVRCILAGGGSVPISVVGPMQSLATTSVETADQDFITIRGASSPDHADTDWMRPCSSTPIEASAEDTVAHEGAEGDRAIVEPGVNSRSSEDDIDEGLVDMDDGDLGEYIVESVRDYSGEIQADRGLVSDAEEAEEAALEEEEIDEVPVRDVGQADALTDSQDAVERVYSQMQRVQDMLASTQQMLDMNTSLIKTTPKDN